MGFDVETFKLTVRSGFGALWFSQPIPCTDASRDGEPHPSRRSLDAWGALGLVLHYLNFTMLEITLQQIIALIPTTVSCYITFGLQILLETLCGLPDAAIQWPVHNMEFQYDSNLIVACHPCLDGAFASIDDLNLPTQTSTDPDIENATYNGWLSEHYISSVVVFSSRGECKLEISPPLPLAHIVILISHLKLIWKVLSSLVALMHLEVGMILMLLRQFMRNCWMIHLMVFIW